MATKISYNKSREDQYNYKDAKEEKVDRHGAPARSAISHSSPQSGRMDASRASSWSSRGADSRTGAVAQRSMGKSQFKDARAFLNDEIIATRFALKRGDWKDWAAIYNSKIQQFDVVNAVTALYTAACHLPDNAKSEFLEANSSRVDALLKKIEKDIASDKPRGISNAICACAKLYMKGSDLLQRYPNFLTAISSAARAKIERFSAMEMANLAHAYGKLLVQDDDLMGDIANAALQKIGAFEPQGLAMLAETCERLGYYHEELMGKIAEKSLENIDRFEPMHLAMVASAFAKLDDYDEDLFQAIARAAPRGINKLEPSQLSKMAYAFARFEFYDEELMQAIAQATIGQINRFGGAALVNILWSLGALRIDNQDLVASIAQQCLRKDEEGKSICDRLTPKQLSQITFALSSLGIPYPAFTKAIVERVKEVHAQLDIEQLCNIALNLMIYHNACDATSTPSNLEDHMFLYALLLLINKRKAEIGKKSAKQITMLYAEIMMIILYLEKLQGKKLDPALIPMREEMEEVVASRSPPSSSTSHELIHRDLLQILQRNPKDLPFEIPAGPFFIDTVLDLSRKTAIDVKGPTHRLRSGRTTGEDLFRERALKALGWTLIAIDTDEYHEARHKRREYDFLREFIPNEYLPKGRQTAAAQGKKRDREKEEQDANTRLAKKARI